MKTAFFLIPAASLFFFACKSNELPQKRPDPPASAVLSSPKVVPADWPLTKDEHDFLTSSVRRKALDPKELQKIGLHTRKEIVAFAYRVLEMDLAPIARTMNDDAYYLVPNGAYVLISYYGSQEDARKHFEAVKALDGEFSEFGDQAIRGRMSPMIETLGYYLMRDHLMPQKERALMVELEDFLYRCSELDADSCWPYENMGSPNNYFRSSAVAAIGYGCSERTKIRAKKYAANPRGSLEFIEGEIMLAEIDYVENSGDFIKQRLPPVLPESEIDR